jgi:HEAT repeat protein
MPLVERLSPDPSAASEPSWHAGLRKIASENADALSLLGRVSGDPKDPSRIAALRGLAGMNSETAARVLAAIWRGDPSCRTACVDGIAETKRPELLEAFVQTLPQEGRPRVVSSMAKAIENTDRPPAGSSAAIVAAFRRPGSEDEGSGVLDMKGALLNVAARLYSMGRDSGAGECLSASLSDSDSEVRARGLSAIARHPSPDLTPALQLAASQDPSPYNRELAAYALRKGDPAGQEPNLFWDLEQLRADLARREDGNGGKGTRAVKKSTVEDPVIEELLRQIQVKEDKLGELRRR